MSDVSGAAERLRAWLSANPGKYDYEYPDLDEIMVAARAVVHEGAQVQMSDFLYLLARDETFGCILELLPENRPLAWEVARAGVNSKDPDVRGEIAELLTELGGPEAEMLLQNLANDECEYVRLKTRDAIDHRKGEDDG